MYVCIRIQRNDLLFAFIILGLQPRIKGDFLVGKQYRLKLEVSLFERILSY